MCYVGTKNMWKYLNIQVLLATVDPEVGNITDQNIISHLPKIAFSPHRFTKYTPLHNIDTTEKHQVAFEY